jgi:hypothetical protein
VKHFIGVLDTHNNDLRARVAKLTMSAIQGTSHFYPALSFYADDQTQAEAYFVAHYRHLFQVELAPGEFTVTEQAA